MDPYLGRTLGYIFLIGGLSFGLVGTYLTWHFGKKVEEIAPYRQPIRSATSTVEIVIESDKEINTTYMDRGGYIAFGKGNEALVTMASTQCRARQMGESKVLYRGVFNMDAKDQAVGKPLNYLKETEFIQISFLPMPKETNVISGEAICTFNNLIQIKITIPSQEIKNGLIFAHNLHKVFSGFEK
jgi:hypothetical protein